MGKDRHGKSQVVMWNTARVAHSAGDVSVLAKAHTDASIERMRVAAFDDSRYMVVSFPDLFISSGREESGNETRYMIHINM